PMAFGGEEFHLDPMAGRGPSDAITLPAAGELSVSGWTYDALKVEPARGVVARIDDRLEVPLQYGLRRQEAAKRTGDGRLVPIGFAGRLSGHLLGPGEHRIRFRVLGVDGCLVYDPALRLSVTVEG